MASIIIYNINTHLLNQTIDNIIDLTPPQYLDEIIICDDRDELAKEPIEINDSRVKIQRTFNIGCANAWNQAVKDSISHHLIFILGTVKVSNDWIQPLLDRLTDEQTIASPRIHSLNTRFWTTESNYYNYIGWRWDFTRYNRLVSDVAPSVLSHCFAMNKQWLYHIGGFDNGMVGVGGEDIEISIRTWLYGGQIQLADTSIVAADFNVIYNGHNYSRIIDSWCDGFKNPKQVLSNNKINNLLAFKNQAKYDFQWYIENIQPELASLHKLQQIGSNRHIAVVYPGPSIDIIDKSLLNRYDLIIGVDHIAQYIKCDFVITNQVSILYALRQKYRYDQFILPLTILDYTNGKYVSSQSISSSFNLIEFAAINKISLSPPFCDFGDLILSMVQVLISINPKSITIYGYDNKIINGRKYAASIHEYDDLIAVENENELKRMTYNDYVLDALSKQALEMGIPILRTSYA